MHLLRQKEFENWYSTYGTPAKKRRYFQALRDPHYVLNDRATNPVPGYSQTINHGLFSFSSIYEVTDLVQLRNLFEATPKTAVADDGSMHSAIGNYAMWLRLVSDEEDWVNEPLWEGDDVSPNSGAKSRVKTLNGNGLDYKKALSNRKATYKMDKYLASIRTKPFVLLAGISGTGKSRLVRQLARGFCPEEGPLADEKKPGNFEMIQVRPNWHDSTELMGYVTRLTSDQKPKYVVTDFLRFLVRAEIYRQTPFFLCLDEMNLAPVEQYFAEYLSVIETRRKEGFRFWFNFDKDGETVTTETPAIRTDRLIKIDDAEMLETAINEVFEDPMIAAAPEEARESIRVILKANHGFRIPQNLVVIGTVNMDETTFSFSRKVLDRAMSFELNEVNMRDGLIASTKTPLGAFGHDGSPLQSYIEADEVYPSNKELCDKVLNYLEKVNEKLDKTPFKIAYRSRNEIMIYCVERTRNGLVPLAQALDEATSMKILSRIEGDRRRLRVDNSRTLLDVLKETIEGELKALNGDGELPTHVCRDKLEEMKAQLEGGYTSFWTR